MKMIGESRNDLLKRKEIVVEMQSHGSPTYEQVKKELSGKFKTEDSLIVIQKVSGKFGSNHFVVSAFIYDSNEAKERVEPRPKVKKGGSS